MSATLEFLRVIFLLLAPQVLRNLLSVLQHPSESKWDGVEYCVLLVAVGLLGAICETHTYFQLNNAGIKMKTALISALYRKSLKLLQPSGIFKTKVRVGKNQLPLQFISLQNLTLWIWYLWIVQTFKRHYDSSTFLGHVPYKYVFRCISSTISSKEQWSQVKIFRIRYRLVKVIFFFLDKRHPNFFVYVALYFKGYICVF